MMAQSINGYPGLVVCSPAENSNSHSIADCTRRPTEAQSSFSIGNPQLPMGSHQEALDSSKNTMTINEAFDRLREVVPSFPFEKE